MNNQGTLIPDSYRPILDGRETERAIKLTKDFFETSLAETLNLKRVTAPLFVESGSGVNDDLNGIEKPVTFQVKDLGSRQVESCNRLPSGSGSHSPSSVSIPERASIPT